MKYSILFRTVIFAALVPLVIDAKAFGVKVGEDFFGLHVRFTSVSAPGKRVLSVWPWIPFGSIRLWHSYAAWYEVEPRRGEFNFRFLDDQVARSRMSGSRIIYTLGRTPAWASSRPNEPCGQTLGCAAEPQNIEDWERYVAAITNRYRGSIEAYEIWNEPAFSDFEPVLREDGRARQYYSGSSSSMVELTRRARLVIKAIDPNAKIVSPSVTSEGNGLGRLEKYLKSGGGKYVDVIGYHFYLTNPEDIISEVMQLRRLLSKYGLEHLPIWDTETGYVMANKGEHVSGAGRRRGWSSPMTEEMAAAYLARSMLIQASLGIGRVYWFNWDHDLPEGPMGISRRGVDLTKAGYAYMRIRSWMNGATLGPPERRSNGMFGIRVDFGGKAGTILWSVDGAKGERVSEDSLVEPLDGDVRFVRKNESFDVGVVPVLISPKP